MVALSVIILILFIVFLLALIVGLIVLTILLVVLIKFFVTLNKNKQLQNETIQEKVLKYDGLIQESIKSKEELELKKLRMEIAQLKGESELKNSKLSELHTSK